jgi:hypothetical protein
MFSTRLVMGETVLTTFRALAVEAGAKVGVGVAV